MSAIEITDADVIFGRSKEAKMLAATHPGTISIKELAQQHVAVYEKADKTPSVLDEPGKVTKQSLNLMLLKVVNERGGRVLVKDKRGGPWVVAPKPVSNLSTLFRKKQITPDESPPSRKPPKTSKKTRPSRKREPKRKGAEEPQNVHVFGERLGGDSLLVSKAPAQTLPTLLDEPPSSDKPSSKGPDAQLPEWLDVGSGRTLDSSGSNLIRSFLGPDDPSSRPSSVREEGQERQLSASGPVTPHLATPPEDCGAAALKRGRGTNDSVCSVQPELKRISCGQDDTEDDMSTIGPLPKRPPLEPGLSYTDLSRAGSELTDGFGSVAEALSVDILSCSLSHSDETRAFSLRSSGLGVSQTRSEAGSNTRSLYAGSSLGLSDHSYRSLIGGNATGDPLARSQGSNARSFLSGISFGGGSSVTRNDSSRFGHQSYSASVDTFSVNTPVARSCAEEDAAGRSVHASLASSAFLTSVASSIDDLTLYDLAEGVSAVSIEQSDISSLTFQTPRTVQNDLRLRGGRVAVEREVPALQMPRDTVIRAPKRDDIEDDHSAITMGTDMDVCKLLDRMKSEPTNALLQIRCFGELADIAWEHMTEDVSKEVVDSMQDLISIMKQNRQDSQVQGHCCMAFGWLAYNNPTLKRFIAFFGGVEAIVCALREHKDDELTQANACSALSSLACNDGQNQKKIAAEGGINSVVRAMDNHLKSAVVQKNGCGALSYIARGSTANTIAVANDDGIIAIVRGMRMHGDNDEVQINGIWALGTLSSHITSVRDSVAKTGGIGTILSGMLHHPESEEVQTSGCLSLQHLAHEQYLESFVDAKGVDIILAAMNAFKSNETIQLIGCIVVGKLAGSSTEAQETTTFADGVNTILSVTQKTWTDLNVNNEARIALGRLAKSNNVAQKRIAQAVVCAMRAARQDAEVQANCCCTLETIAKEDNESRQWIVAAGGVEAVRVAKLNHPDNDHIWTMTLASLTNDLDEEENTEVIEDMLSVVETMDEYEEDGPRQEQSCRKLVQLLSSNSNNPNVGGTFVSAYGMNALITAMDLFPENLRIQGNGCASLFMLCVDNIDGRKSFIEEGGAQVLVSTMNNWPTRESVQCYGCKVLELLVTESAESCSDVYEAGAWRALHDAKALFPGNPSLTRAANNTLSLLASHVGMESVSESHHSSFYRSGNSIVPPIGG